MKVLWLTNIPSPYRVNFFNELGKLCDLTVLFERKFSSERDESWKSYNVSNFKSIFLRGIKIGVAEAICFSVKKHLTKEYDRIIVSNFSSPTGMLAISNMKRRKIAYYLESDGGFAGSGKGVKEKIKKHVISGAKGYFSTSEENDKYFISYGAEKERIIRYPFTSLYASDIIDTPLTIEEKLDLRKKLGITEEKVVLAVGQFIHRKGFDVLLKAIVDLPRDIGVYFVGGVPTEEYENLKTDNELTNVHFIGFKNKKELKDYYKTADVFVLPTREDIWGLVINEAMSCGLPVITTNKCIAGLELVENGENGYIINVGDDNALAEKIELILTNKELQDQMGKKSIEKIRYYTFENMAKNHINNLK